MSDFHGRAKQLFSDDPELCMEIARFVAMKTASAGSITEHQRELFDFVAQTIAKRNGPPTYEEMADHMGIVKSNAYRMVESLVAAGFLAKRVHGAKTIITLGTG